MNLCNVNGTVPDLKKHHPLPKVDKEHDRLQQTLGNTRMCLFLLDFCDQSWGFGIKASGPSQVRKWLPSVSKSVLDLNG